MFSKDLDTLVAYPAAKNSPSYSIPGKVTHIGNRAFYRCSRLGKIKIPGNLTHIGEKAFYGCSSLPEIKIPGKVIHIGDGAFAFCEKLTEIEAAGGNKFFAGRDGILYDKDFTALIAYPAGYTAVPKRARSFGFGNGKTEKKAQRPLSWNMPEGIIRIGPYAFAGASALSSITLPGDLKTLGERAFAGCSDLNAINIPGEVAGIGGGVFDGCPRLGIITLDALRPPELESNFLLFDEAWRGGIYVPPAALNAYRQAKGWKDYAGMINP
ncbi:MAG: leucine-rich repeat domain-containing protein [Treponema sp.]|nr:leucine-rich repeat domain-containing protein [Treponema sp.]